MPSITPTWPACTCERREAHFVGNSFKPHSPGCLVEDDENHKFLFLMFYSQATCFRFKRLGPLCLHPALSSLLNSESPGMNRPMRGSLLARWDAISPLLNTPLIGHSPTPGTRPLFGAQSGPSNSCKSLLYYSVRKNALALILYTICPPLRALLRKESTPLLLRVSRIPEISLI